MALILPSAPANFYEPSLTVFKESVLRVNGSTKGQMALITAVPANIENAWAAVGVAGDTVQATNRGSFVIGNTDVVDITGPLIGPEESPGETGYKLTFDATPEMTIYIDGTGTTTATVIGAAILEGVDTYAGGTTDHLKYIFKTDPIVVTDGGLISLPEMELIINYSEEVPVV